VYLSLEERTNFGTPETNAKIIFSKCVTELVNIGITINKIIIDMNLSYVDAMEYLIKKVSIEKANQSDVTYFFYDDLPNPQLN
jgi:hypothetical protein